LQDFLAVHVGAGFKPALSGSLFKNGTFDLMVLLFSPSANDQTRPERPQNHRDNGIFTQDGQDMGTKQKILFEKQETPEYLHGWTG